MGASSLDVAVHRGRRSMRRPVCLLSLGSQPGRAVDDGARRRSVLHILELVMFQWSLGLPPADVEEAPKYFPPIFHYFAIPKLALLVRHGYGHPERLVGNEDQQPTFERIVGLHPDRIAPLVGLERLIDNKLPIFGGQP